MVKQLLFMVWICGASLAGATATDMPFWPGHGQGDAEGDLVSLAYTSTELLSAPQVRNGTVHGYVLAKFAYGTDAGHGEEGPDASLWIADAFTDLVSRGGLDTTGNGWPLSIDQIALDIQARVNAAAGSQMLRTVYITQMDFLARDEIRANSAARREAFGGH